MLSKPCGTFSHRISTHHLSCLQPIWFSLLDYGERLPIRAESVLLLTNNNKKCMPQSCVLCILCMLLIHSFTHFHLMGKHASYRALFGLPAGEEVLHDCAAALMQSMLHHGRLYFSQHYLCFYSNLFGIKIIVHNWHSGPLIICSGDHIHCRHSDCGERGQHVSQSRN